MIINNQINFTSAGNGAFSEIWQIDESKLYIPTKTATSSVTILNATYQISEFTSNNKAFNGIYFIQSAANTFGDGAYVQEAGSYTSRVRQTLELKYMVSIYNGSNLSITVASKQREFTQAKTYKQGATVTAPAISTITTVDWPASFTWVSDYYKTINFYNRSPDGDFLVWLEANAVKQTT